MGFRVYYPVPMASDAHAHPQDLLKVFPEAEAERRACKVACAASSWNEAEFLAQESLSASAKADHAAPMVLCFGVHPQLVLQDPKSVGPSWEYLNKLVAEKRIASIGEIGFDLFDEDYRAIEGAQERLFRAEISLAVEYSLPVVLHIRKAMHKVFAYSRELARLPAVILHSYSGTLREAIDLRSRGIQAYFSFGTPIVLNHKRAMEAVAGLPSETLLVETDAPYQALKGSRFPDAKPFSSWSDLTLILHGAASLRRAARAGEAEYGVLEKCCDKNFRLAYGLSGNDGIC